MAGVLSMDKGCSTKSSAGFVLEKNERKVPMIIAKSCNLHLSLSRFFS
jgi:hypothetical protein